MRGVAALRGPQRSLSPVDAAVPAARVAKRPGAAGPAGVPREERRDLTKGQIALDLLDQARAEGWPGRVVVADAGYGVSGPFRRELEARGLYYLVGVSEPMIVFTEAPRWEWPDAALRGRSAPRRRPRLEKDAPQPVTLAEVAARTPLRRVTWRPGTKGPLRARFAWLRVWPAYGWEAGECAGAEPHWLLIEQRPDNSVRYAFSNLPANTSRLRAVRYGRSRWPVEQGYQQMKEELGLDHFEGRSWHGFHRHGVLVMMAYGFLTLERLRLQQQQEVSRSARATVPALKKKRCRGEGDEPAGPRLTLPAVRRALQRFLMRPCHLDCPYCRVLAHR